MLATRGDFLFQSFCSSHVHTSPSFAGAILHFIQTEHAQNMNNAVRLNVLHSLNPETLCCESERHDNSSCVKVVKVCSKKHAQP